MNVQHINAVIAREPLGAWERRYIGDLPSSMTAEEKRSEAERLTSLLADTTVEVVVYSGICLGVALTDAGRAAIPVHPHFQFRGLTGAQWRLAVALRDGRIDLPTAIRAFGGERYGAPLLAWARRAVDDPTMPPCPERPLGARGYDDNEFHELYGWTWAGYGGDPAGD